MIGVILIYIDYICLHLVKTIREKIKKSTTSKLELTADLKGKLEIKQIVIDLDTRVHSLLTLRKNQP